MTSSELASKLNLTRQAVSKLARRGMPLESAEAALLAKLEEHPCEARRIFREAILNAPAPKLFQS